MMMIGGRTKLLEICCCLLLFSQESQCGDPQTQHLSSYQLTVPRPVGGRFRREANGTLPSQVSYIIPVDGLDHIVHLQRNQLLLPADFTVFSYSQNGSLITSRPPVQNHCHYHGFVENMPESSVAMSICNGLRGVLRLPDNSYGIEPLESDPNQHLLYRLQDVTSQPQGCATSHGDRHYDPTEEIPHTRQHKRMKRAVLHQTHYVELLLVVDNDRFNYMNRNDTAVREEMVHLANFIDSIYIQLNVRVVLVGLEIWTQQNLISTDGGAGEVLSRFTQWREKALVPRRRHDSAQLILKKSFGGTAGMAFVSTVCSRSHGGGINAFPNTNLPAFASIVAHELGHNLGMNHDDGRSCTCPTAACIMNSGTTESRNFSSCSADDFEKMILLTGGTCLLNVPHPDEAYSSPYCGNRLVDVGEECDCGSQKECEKDPCCEYQTCKLKPGAQCAYGECCSGCQYLAGGTVCRSSTDECDLPEFCNGSSSLCQSDVFVQNGQPCRSQQAYCYNGKCRHHDGQCQDIFGSKAKASPEICFKDVNNKGDRFGNCGYHNYGYKKCESRNALCGKLQCSNIQTSIVFGIQPSIISTSIGGAKCYGVDFRLGSDVPDPGMVNEGTKCGEDKVCVNFECRSADILNYDCDVEKKCHGHGVCNSNKNCHCDDGWAPPFCELQGYGGSVDSGPTWNDKDTSLRDGLLVFFFLILPLLILTAFVYLRKNEFLRCLGLQRRKRSEAYQVDKATPVNRSRGPPPRVPPPVSLGNSDNVRDGHHAQLLLPPQVVETSRTAPAFAPRPPPPPLKPKPPPASHPLVPQRPAPAPPV
ncbi:disintegrin and metalloproteinase domain-containing protein 9 [Takifugu rubripes]|uniref:disintegrin and metalloproteinase domain-containing protein 9 n=1 Tax=Takifugu rubripes TaxID=31033 RepID=UPI0005D19C81|nr:disintegrin and metalloproteinase domain-containing protein 9 [Takifugu rubripes]|eukprot:XP_011613609.1 PREDICTED: disintegrin and metalloproteinase domain-containing protein 9 [Takifugu rubripes]